MKIIINKWEYEISLVKEDDKILDMGDGYYHSGITDLKEQKIYIQEGLNSQQMWYTVVHELTHAYLQAYGMLQVAYTDEIVADIMGIYGQYIIETAKDVITHIYCPIAYYIDKKKKK